MNKKVSKADRLRDLYRNILASVNVYEDEGGQGELSIYYGNQEDDPIPVTSNRDDGAVRRLVIPTQRYLKEGDWENYLPFHPLCEHVMRGESETIKILKNLVLFRLRVTISELVINLLYIAGNDDIHDKLTPAQSKLLSDYKLDQVTDKTIRRARKLFDERLDEIVNIYLHHFETHDGVEYKRLAAVSFPIYRKLVEESGKVVMGVDLGTKRDKGQIANAFRALIENIDEQDAYYFGSKKQIAPNFHALMGAYANLARVLNKFTHKFRKHIPHSESLKIGTDWLDDFDEIEQFKAAIPSLPGNEGAVVDQQDNSEQTQRPTLDASRHAQKAASLTSRADRQLETKAEQGQMDTQDDSKPPFVPNVPNPTASTQNQPQQPLQPPQVQSASSGSGSGKISWRDFQRSQSQPPQFPGHPQPGHPPAQPAGFHQPMGGGYPAQQPMAGGYPPQQPMGAYPGQQPMNQWSMQQNPAPAWAQQPNPASGYGFGGGRQI